MIQSCVSKETSNFPCISWKRFDALGFFLQMFPTILIPAIDQPCSPGLPSPPPSLPTSHSLFPVRPLSDWSERKERLKETRAIAEGSHSCRSVCEKVFTRHGTSLSMRSSTNCCKFSTRSMLFRHNLEWSMKPAFPNGGHRYTQTLRCSLFQADTHTH